MTVELAVSIAGVAISMVSGYWAIARLVVAQFDKRLDERFKALDQARKEGSKVWADRFERMERRQMEFDRDLTGLIRELPTSYVRREDSIRENTTINAKLDALNARLEHVITQGSRP
jgi:hypothetical protein